MLSYMLLAALAVADSLPPPAEDASQRQAKPAKRLVDCVPVKITCGSSYGCLLSDLRSITEESIFCGSSEGEYSVPPGGEASVEIDRRTHRIVYIWPAGNQASTNYYDVTVPVLATGCNLNISNVGRSTVSLECELDKNLLPTGDPTDGSGNPELQAQKVRLVQAAAKKPAVETVEAAANARADDAAIQAKP